MISRAQVVKLCTVGLTCFCSTSKHNNNNNSISISNNADRLTVTTINKAPASSSSSSSCLALMPASSTSFHPPPKEAIQNGQNGDQNDNGQNNGKEYYKSNPTIFGRILEGSAPCSPISESDSLFTFQDRTPRAPLHALVIPKRFVKSVYDLKPSPRSRSMDNHNNNMSKETDDLDLELVTSMERTALETIKSWHPHAYDNKDYILCFHIPPFTSVDHLHLHVLAPASDMSWMYRYAKYRRGTRWCTGIEEVVQALASGKRFQ
eukprot:CAMPEP_0194107588 /NCGR_PEP_ID=MMETSP0150-20130528/7449_1 /TAXON_ID=122233 /ORGANISM="Chaetoceros debilis, Strain MM31A-1" /LENGTH=262 /DNA_ID=CAMNT_0038796057 /DNA_START=93 /DNA_END=881 /DNA_ORIENTATION=+